MSNEKAAPIPEDLRGAYIEAQMGYNATPDEVMAYIERIAALTAELTSVKDGNGWWEVTPAGQKKRYSVNEEEELRIACEEITALKAEIARLSAPVNFEAETAYLNEMKALITSSQSNKDRQLTAQDYQSTVPMKIIEPKEK